MSALILAAVHSLLLWEIDQHSGTNEADRALREALARVAPYQRDDLLARLLSAVMATARDERVREDARMALAFLAHARRADLAAMRGEAQAADADTRRTDGEETPRRR